MLATAMTEIGGTPLAPTSAPPLSAQPLSAQPLSAQQGGPARVEGADASARAIAELRPLVRAVVARVLGAAASEADVEDGAHEALRRALEGWERLRPGEPVGPWVAGIARHVALDQRRSRARRREDGGERSAAALERAEDPAPDVDVALDARRRAVLVDAALAELPEGTRSALIAFHVEGLGYQAIAAKLGVPLGTVATWVARGRRRLAEALRDAPGEESNSPPGGPGGNTNSGRNPS